MDDCILWEGTTLNSGYGQRRFNGVKMLAHRVAFIKHYGEIPEGLVVRHKCDVRNCVNPEHLELGTQSDNLKDCVSRGRHPNANLTDEQVREIRKDPRSSRVCAEVYGVGYKSIQAIKAKRYYSHVED